MGIKKAAGGQRAIGTQEALRVEPKLSGAISPRDHDCVQEIRFAGQTHFTMLAQAAVIFFLQGAIDEATTVESILEVTHGHEDHRILF
jgi:hypothetical protein